MSQVFTVAPSQRSPLLNSQILELPRVTLITPIALASSVKGLRNGKCMKLLLIHSRKHHAWLLDIADLWPHQRKTACSQHFLQVHHNHCRMILL
ncbi:hypothetical protein RHGRI_009597 [Rhododendron griersonianum]|uniref:Uncharacterized protein n=1 Tax=Rhododendron griersonianum TaxID=479676 RepID=A0AAV6KFC0_9ERIC|nr:hypothetical protein RHGRI_009597 [Rhododendron griersonianum]